MYNTQKFIDKAKKKHGDLYNYSLVEYISSKNKVKIICKKHGIFEQIAAQHLIGRGCIICGGSKKRTNNEFIKESIKKHGNLYDYSLTEYKDANSNVKIICKKHGLFEQNAYYHLKGCKCPKCYLDSKIKTTEQFIIDSKEIHGDLYNYSKVNYIKNNIPVEIICKVHGSFYQQPSVHLNKGNCPKCADEKKKLTKLQFIENSIKIHGELYDYSKSIYINNYTKIEIICKAHGSFFQTPNFHMLGQGCPSCKKSLMENKISKLLENNNIIFERQKTFNECKNINNLPFDFYLPEFNVCIEYNGKQHYEPIEWFGGNKTFKYIQNNDKIKKEFCLKNKIKYIEISYKKCELIEEIIKKIINYDK